MPPRRRDEYTFPPEWIPRHERSPAWLRQLAIDFKYTSRVFLVILAVFMIGAPLAPLVWLHLNPPTRVEDLIRIHGRLRSSERRETWAEEGPNPVELRILIEGTTQTFVINSDFYGRCFDYDAFAAGVKRGDAITVSAKRKDIETPRLTYVWIYRLSSASTVYLAEADALRNERTSRTIGIVLAIGLFLVDVWVTAVVIRDAARRAA